MKIKVNDQFKVEINNFQEVIDEAEHWVNKIDDLETNINKIG